MNTGQEQENGKRYTAGNSEEEDFYVVDPNDKNYLTYIVAKDGNGYHFNECSPSDIYRGDASYRKSRKLDKQAPRLQDVFVDTQFEWFIDEEKDIDSKKKPFTKRRIYELYDEEFGIFDPQYFTDTFIEYNDFYPTFISEFSMIDREYLKTIFITNRVNKEGFYEYFVRRNGEYYVEYIDDTIPVQGNAQVPVWGLNIKEPWKIILMKAWIKEKNGLQGVKNARPYEFIECFGMPGYRAISLKKQFDSIQKSKMRLETKIKKEEKIPINMPGFVTVGKTRNSKNVQDLGLHRNRAAYRIFPIAGHNKSKIGGSEISGGDANQENIYKVKSPLYHQWTGSHSVAVKNGPINKTFKPEYQMNLQRDFIASYTEISEVFSKFFIAPEYKSKYEHGNLLQDSYLLPIQSQNPHYMFELKAGGQGFININIELPYYSADLFGNDQQNYKERYAPIKFIMAQRKGRTNQYSYFDIDYVKAYHNSINRFLKLDEGGEYVIYVKVDTSQARKLDRVAININSVAKIDSFKQIKPTQKQKSKILNDFFNDYSKQHGHKYYFNKKNRDTLVVLGNMFQEIGFGFISIWSKENANNEVALKVTPSNLNLHNMIICNEAHPDKDEKEFTLIAHKDQIKTVVFERPQRQKYQRGIFPPEDIADFYEII